MATVPSRVHRAKLKKRIGYKYPQPYQVAVKRAGELYDRIYAIFYGGCVGDALGLLTETLSKEEAKKIFGKVCSKLELVHKKLLQDCHRRKWAVYDWTEETDLVILTIQSLVANRGKVVPEDLAKRLMDWYEHGFSELADTAGVGLCNFTKGLLAHPQFSEKPHTAAEIVWRNSRCELSTNCALSRAPLMGVHYYNVLGKVIKNSLDVCSVTDADPRCHASSVAVSVAVSAMLQRDPKHLKKNDQYDIDSIIEESYSYSMRCLLGLPYQEVKKLKNVLFTTSLKDLKLDEPGKANDTYKTLGAGFWALKQKDFRSAVQEIVMEGGDADANASLAGAMLGCKLGLKAIPVSWIESLLHRFWLDEIIDSYLNLMERGAFKPKCETVV